MPALLVLGILGGGWLAVRTIQKGDDGSKSVDVVDVSAAANSRDESLITLPEGKVAAAGFRKQAVTRQRVVHSHVLSGRLRYDESKHIEVMSPVDGILTAVLVKPGDRVDAGHLLAVLSSPEIGRARSEVMTRASRLALVRRTNERAHQLSNNVDSLIKALDSAASIDVIEAEFADVALGTFREGLLSAYSRMILAKATSDNLRQLTGSGAVAGRTVREQESARQVALADYASIREQAAFDAEQQRMQADSELAEAERELKIAQQQRDSLLGYPEENAPTDTPELLSRIEIRAPFAGTIEKRSFAQSERISQNDALFVLADTSSLYVAADIRENDWPAVQLAAGESVTVSIPAIEGREFTAEVLYIGRQVVPDSNSVQLIATLENTAGWLRPGMFVRVEVPVGEPRNALAVHPASVLRHDDKAFVFVALEDRVFQRIDITTGIDSGEWLEVTSGLQEGQQVVEDGAFLLKSAWLLEAVE